MQVQLQHTTSTSICNFNFNMQLQLQHITSTSTYNFNFNMQLKFQQDKKQKNVDLSEGYQELCSKFRTDSWLQRYWPSWSCTLKLKLYFWRCSWTFFEGVVWTKNIALSEGFLIQFSELKSDSRFLRYYPTWTFVEVCFLRFWGPSWRYLCL